MAEAFFNHLAAGRYTARSAGTEPAAAPHPEVVRSMNERGVPIEEGAGVKLTPELVQRSRRVVGMGCNVHEACPALQVPLDDWQLEDPRGRSPREVDVIRDEVEKRVRDLLEELERQG